VRYTRKKDIIEITVFITIIMFFILTAFIEGVINKAVAQEIMQESSQSDYENTIISNEVTNQVTNSTQNSTQNNIKNNVNNTVSNVNSNTNNATGNTQNTTKTGIKDKNNKWRIEIPKIGLNAPIKEGTTQEIMLEAVGHFTDTPKDTGNIGLAAHNRGYECNFFERIKELKKGDKIIYKTANKTRTYLVETNTVIKQTNWNYLKATKDNRITLITCEKDKREYRRCIQALEVK
jgi:LPXTG-site transpeptidase (sortase) family protein